MKLIISIIGLFLVLGCSTTEPTVVEYILNSPNTSSTSEAQGCKQKSIKVSHAFAKPSLMSLKMDYAESNNKIFSYSVAQWNQSPNRVITQKIYTEIRDYNIFKNTLVSKSRTRSDFILEINIEDFLQYYSADLKKSYANVVISLSIIDSRTYNVISNKTFSAKVDTKTLDAEGGVVALESALNNILVQNKEWLDGVCK